MSKATIHEREDTVVRARADVVTDKPARYAKQLSSHLGRRCSITEESGGVRITLPSESGAGSCLLASRGSVLELHAEAADDETMSSVHDVIGRHLERFGERDGLTVSWQAVE